MWIDAKSGARDATATFAISSAEAPRAASLQQAASPGCWVLLVALLLAGLQRPLQGGERPAQESLPNGDVHMPT